MGERYSLTSVSKAKTVGGMGGGGGRTEHCSLAGVLVPIVYCVKGVVVVVVVGGVGVWTDADSLLCKEGYCCMTTVRTVGEHFLQCGG